MNMMRLSLIFSFLIAASAFSGSSAHADSSSASSASGHSSASNSGTGALRYLVVQDAGRLKPFETFARETLQLVYGAQKFKGRDGVSRPAREIVMTWMLVPRYWDQQKIVEINHHGLKESLKLPIDEKYFSPVQLFSNDRLQLVMQELGSYRETKQKLNPYFQAVQRLESQLGLYQAVLSGAALRIVPPAPGASDSASAAAGAGATRGLGAMASAALTAPPEKWLSANELKGDLQAKFATLTRAFIRALPREGESASAEASADSPAAGELDRAVADFETAAKAQNPALWPDETMIRVEVHYKEFHPFMWSWIFYLIAVLVITVSLGFAWQARAVQFDRAAWLAMIAAFLLHTYGFGLRIYLTGRPPVSNMYESVVWVSWGAVVFSMVFEYFTRKRFVMLAGAAIAVLCLVVADLAPTILDGSVQPLEPVLRSNMWLTVHVLTITLSYSAFFLAWGLGNIGLAFIWRGESPTSDRLKNITQSTYRALQVGVVLLAAGTILGGVWADYSWGRFWGWDPKETWAFIALMGYLALLHSRLVGWVRGFGMLAGAVIAFNLVMMAWYGVNFVLGAGLHSYGFGAGGVQYVGSFVLLDLIFVGYVAFVAKTFVGRSPA